MVMARRQVHEGINAPLNSEIKSMVRDKERPAAARILLRGMATLGVASVIAGCGNSPRNMSVCEPLAKQEIQNVISFMVTYFPPPNGKVATRKVHLDQFGAWVQNDNGAIHKLTNLQVSILGIPANLRVSIDATMEISNGRQITKGLFNMEGQECTLHFSKGPTGPVLLS